MAKIMTLTISMPLIMAMFVAFIYL